MTIQPQQNLQFKSLLPFDGRILLLSHEPPLFLCTEEPVEEEPYYEETYAEEQQA